MPANPPDPAPVKLRQVTVLIPVREIPLALAFYRDILGLAVLSVDENRATLAGDDGAPAIVLQATAGRPRVGFTADAPLARLALDAAAFDGIRDRLLAAAVPFRTSVAGTETEITARDLDGNEVVLRRIDAPAPQRRLG